MKNSLFIIGIIIAIAVSCKKQNNSEGLELKGRYSGTFQRELSGKGKTSKISIDFSSNTWSGESEFAQYPGLCYGTFELAQDSIVFTNMCPWTADFDHTLVLVKKYKIDISGKELTISRKYKGGSTDLYRLSKR